MGTWGCTSRGGGSPGVHSLTVCKTRRENSHSGCWTSRHPGGAQDSALPHCRPPQTFLCKTGVMPSLLAFSAGEVSQARAGRPRVRWGWPTDPHGSASREQQAGGPGEGTPPSQELWGPSLGCSHPGSTSHSGENQTISRLARETPAPAGPRGPRPALPRWAQGSGWSPRGGRVQGPASPAALVLHHPRRGLPACAAHRL